MRVSLAALLGLLGGMVCASAATAADYPIEIKTDLDAKFYVVEKGGSAEYPTLVVKRERFSGGPFYTKRAFDCRSRTVQVVGEGPTLAEMNKSKGEDKPQQIEPGSIGAQLWEHVCKKK